MGCNCAKVSTPKKVIQPIEFSNHFVLNPTKSNTTGHHKCISSDNSQTTNISAIKNNYSSISDNSDTFEDAIDSISDINATIPSAANEHVEIVDADPEAFNILFLKQRQDAIDNLTYRSTIESWKPNSLKQLNEMIRNLSKDKSLIHRHWIIFYWIACHIEYDTVSCLNDKIPDQSVEEIFRTKKGANAGYSRLYKYLCDQINIKCEEISGHAKGHGFDDCIPLKSDHAWNAVEIEQHWYLIDSAWSAGSVNDENVFERKLECFYFLTRPHQMIYHHLPDDEKWQLLRTPIQMSQYLQMPKIHSHYFNLNLELIRPLHQAHVSLVHNKSYTLILIRTPSDVDLIGRLKLNGNQVEGGHRVIYDLKKQLYRCYFAPASIGQHKITIYGKKRNDSNTKSYKEALSFTLNIDKLIHNPISYPDTSKKFYDLGLKVISPVNTYLIKISNGETHARIIISAPDDVILCGRLENSEGKKINGGEQVYYDQRNNMWKCRFAPDQDGIFEALIYGKKKSDTGDYTPLILFKIEAIQIPSPPLSYPHMWQLFYDLNLKVKAPKNCSIVSWPENSSFVEILIRTPADVQLSCTIQHNNVDVKNGSLAQFNSEMNLWQLLFAPECIGYHELIIFAKRNSEEQYGCALKFYLNVTQLHLPMKFPTVYRQFHNNRCQIFEPFNGILEKGATIPIHCIIPGATKVNLKVDSKWIKAEGYQDPILKRSILVGSKDITIYAKYGLKSRYHGLIKYTVQ